MLALRRCPVPAGYVLDWVVSCWVVVGGALMRECVNASLQGRGYLGIWAGLVITYCLPQRNRYGGQGASGI